MKLFMLKDSKPVTLLTPLIIWSPLGPINFNCKFDKKDLLKIRPDKVEAGSEDTIISSWSFESCHVEFVRSRISPKLPPDMKPDSCFYGMWRVEVFSKLTLNFTCRISSKFFSSPIASQEHGEGLISQSFEVDNIKLNFGTEDEEYLQQRAALQNWLPRRIENKIKVDLIKCTDEGIEVTLPELIKNEKIQIHFIVAWSTDSSNNSTWYAVDQRPSSLLKQTGID